MASAPELEPGPEPGQSLALGRGRHDPGWGASPPRDDVARFVGLCALLLLILSGYKLALGAGLSLAAVLAVRAMIMAKRGPAVPDPAPPGPRSVPLLGSALSLDFNSMIGSFAGLAKKYGNVFQVKFVGQSVVVLHGYETIREALVGHAELFEDRPVMPMFEHMLEGHGILFSRGERWRQMRRFVLRTLHDFGMGRSIIEEKILEEATFLSAEFEAMRGAPWDPKTMISCAVSNVICSLSFGKRFTYEDKEFMKLLALLSEYVRLLASPVSQINNVFTFLRHLPGPHTRLFENVRRLKAFLSSFIEVHRNAPEQDEPRDFIAAFLARQRKEACNPDTYFTDKTLLVVTLNLFFAATETTSTTLYWALLLLMKNPDVQRRLQEEVLAVIGRERPPSLSDRQKLPFTNAVLYEVQRFAGIVPLTLPHATTRDALFQGYFLPEGTIVFAVLDSVLKDPSQWETPEEFNPSHFLDLDGKFRKRDAFLPFSAGRRVCLGEQLAKAELFLVALLQKFSFVAPRGPDSLSLASQNGITVAPPCRSNSAHHFNCHVALTAPLLQKAWS